MKKELSNIFPNSISKTDSILLVDAAKILAILQGETSITAKTLAKDVKKYYDKIYTSFKDKKVYETTHKDTCIYLEQFKEYIKKQLDDKKFTIDKNVDLNIIKSILSSKKSNEQLTIFNLPLKEDVAEEKITLRNQVIDLQNENRRIKMEAEGYKLLCLELENQLKQIALMKE